MKRKSTSRSLRFDIFNRDGFTCQYCGKKPPETLLELDHILPVSRGGDNSEINLTTSCVDCNQGKSAKILGDIRPTPDADLLYLKATQEAAELERFMDASNRRELATTRVIERLQDIWAECFGGEFVPQDAQIRSWLGRYSPETIQRSFEAAIPAHSRCQIGERRFDQMLRYIGAIMRNINAAEAEEN